MSPGEVEEKWARRWAEARIFEADPDPKRPKVFVTFPFPYMNGPLHLGHAFTSARVDLYARFRRMQGYNVLFPWAWHITGEPIAGAAERVKKKDPQQIRIFREMDGVSEEELKKFVDPEYIASYYIRESREVLKALGHSIDWRREFTTTSLHPPFNAFIEWQYETLREKGYVTKGTHPVVWCPHDESPTGDHDRLRGEGASPVEYILLKFPYDGAFLVAATLRPETIYGVTNIWLNPDATYLRVRVGGEIWILSREALDKLKEQKDPVEVLGEFKGEELTGKKCLHPIHRGEIAILPAPFVDPSSASGVVMSVPSHAPYDYLALRDLQRDPEALARWPILRGIVPISLIETEAFGEHPAIEVCERLGVRDQKDPKAQEATELVYREEFYKGVLKPITGRYAGRRVSEAKKVLVEDFREDGIADKFYDLSEEVVCRCTTRCVVKILKDQWFLNYLDEGWKSLTKEALGTMAIYPPEARTNFEYTIDWLEAKACARKTGLGTPLPWSRDWKVETLSDSTVYMAFYTLARHINAHKIPGEALTREVFDYLFYGREDPQVLGKSRKIDPGVLREMRAEFEYWMPVDLRISAKELIPNHLTFFIFHHVALFPRGKWPKTIGVNGMISIEGEKMSKSKGNFVAIKTALRDYGADATRATLLYSAEGLRDPDWRSKAAADMVDHLKGFLELARTALGAEEMEERPIDRWLLGRFQAHIKRAEEEYEQVRTRAVFQVAFFDVWKDVRWYLRRGKPSRAVLRRSLDIWVRLLSPCTPFLAEEAWELLGNKGFASLAPWPKVEEGLISPEAELWEEVIARTAEDIENILKVTGIEPKRIVLYTAPGWKWEVLEALQGLEKPEMRTAMARVMAVEGLKKMGKEVSKYVGELLKDPSRLAYRARIDEATALRDALEFFKGEFGCAVEVYGPEGDAYDPLKKRAQAAPMKPAIYVE
ncbi:MAG: leucine--tRNA ligase [Candidatus Hydrothermarchaeota archaeon]